MGVNYGMTKPTEGASRSSVPSETDLMGDIIDTIADIGSRLGNGIGASFTPWAVARWHMNPIARSWRTTTPTSNRLIMYPVFSGPDGCTISDLDINTTAVGSAGAVYRVGLWTIDDQDRPFSWTATAQWATLLLDAGTIAIDVGTGQKTLDITDTAIAANTWFAVGGCAQVATAGTHNVEGQAGGSWWSPLGNAASQGAASPPGLGLYQDSVTGAFPAAFTPGGSVALGPGVGFKRSV